jgi:glycosyltransferase involved in cell wall biosynthesis
MLVVVETHPIQYHAPVYRAVVTRGVPVTAIYGSDFSVAGYHDPEFNAAFSWDTDLLSGYESTFLSRVDTGGAGNVTEVRTTGLGAALAAATPSAVLIVGYSPSFHRRAWFEAWRRGYPILFRGETTDGARERSGARDWIRHAALSWAYRSCGRCLYIGSASRAHLRRHGVTEDRLVSSPYCVDATPFDTTDEARHRLRPALRAEWGIGAEQVVVLYSGKLSHRKGVDVLVRAVRSLPSETRGRMVILFLGDGELRTPLEDLARLTPEVQVRFAGFQNQRALSGFYHAADMLALPSRHSETWGLVVNEALLHGLPSVVSDRVGCQADLVVAGRTGERCAPDDPESLAAALVACASLTGREATRRACRDQVAGFGVGAAADGIVEAYHAIAKRSGRAA